MNKPIYSIAEINPLFILLTDDNHLCPLSANMDIVLDELDLLLEGLQGKKVFYKDTCNMIDEVIIKNKKMSCFRRCSNTQANFMTGLIITYQHDINTLFDDSLNNLGNDNYVINNH